MTMRLVEYGTHRAVWVDDKSGKRKVLRHNPPRDWKEVLRWASIHGESRESGSSSLLDMGPLLLEMAMAPKFAVVKDNPFFIAPSHETDYSAGYEPGLGMEFTPTALPHGFDPSAHECGHGRVEFDALAFGHDPVAFGQLKRSPLGCDLGQALADVLADMVADVQGHEEVTQLVRDEIAKQAAAGRIAVSPAEDAVAPKRKQLLDATEARNVLDNPLLRLPGTSSDRVGGIKLRRAEPAEGVGNPSLGQFRDFRDAPRTLPQWNPHTIVGALQHPKALSEDLLDEPTLKEIARAASQYRRAQGVLGGEAGPESAELYVRIFRALQLDANALSKLTATEVERLYLAYLSVHAS